MRTYLVLLIVLFSAAAARAQERLSLQQAIERALAHNYEIRVARNVAGQAAENNTLGNAGFLPSIIAGGGVNGGSSNTRIEFATGDVQQRTGARTVTVNGGVALDWELFNGGRMFLQRRQLGMQEQIGELQLKAQIQTTVSEVIQAYAQAVYQQQQGVAIDTGLALARLRMALSQARFETGMAPKVDFLQARVDYNARQSDSLNRVAQLVTAFGNLNVLMGEREDKTYIVDDTLATSLDLSPAELDLLTDANYSLQAARAGVEVSRLNARIARSYMLPSLALSGGYNYTRTQSEAGFALFNRTFGPSGGLNLTVPIFQGGNIRRQYRVASLQAMQDELLYARRHTDFARQYRTAWSNYRVAVQAYRLELDNIGYARENLDIQKARFRVGVANTLETRQAELDYVLALQRLNTAAYNLKLYETQVLELENELVR